jgi:hypothetical protein
LYATRESLNRARVEQVAQRINSHAALGGGLDEHSVES